MEKISGPSVSGLVQRDVLVVSFGVYEIRETTQAYALRDEIISLVDSTQMQKVVLDMANVRYIGSIGFLAFLGVRRHLTGGRIVICNMAGAVREMFTACRLIPTEKTSTAPFEVAARLSDALLSCAENPASA